MILSGQTNAILEQLGIYDDLVKISKPIESVGFLDKNNEKIGSTDFRSVYAL